VKRSSMSSHWSTASHYPLTDDEVARLLPIGLARAAEVEPAADAQPAP